MCNALVTLILRIDRKRVFRFAPLQGETARTMLPRLPGDAGEWSVIVVDESGVHDQSDAALEICRRVGGLWSILGLLRCVPRSLRNAVYRAVARNRYRWFGRKDACRVPAKDELERFLS